MQTADIAYDHRLEARRSGREARIMAPAYLAVGVVVGIMALFVDWRAAILPVLIGLALYGAVLIGAPQPGQVTPLLFAIDRDGIQLGDSPVEPWRAFSAVKLQSQFFGARGAYLVIDYADTGRRSASVALSELNVSVEDVRAALRHHAPHLLGSENPLLRA
ncbi:MAG TPA: hypothetical protein VGN91_20130 [Bosea sp. (in: a-proteobacteria)]|jgi:hypothetical protein|nr:hypothetical protein [Bosea sp. (in: a-proteobacteria)]